MRRHLHTRTPSDLWWPSSSVGFRRLFISQTKATADCYQSIKCPPLHRPAAAKISTLFLRIFNVSHSLEQNQSLNFRFSRPVWPQKVDGPQPILTRRSPVGTKARRHSPRSPTVVAIIAIFASLAPRSGHFHAVSSRSIRNGTLSASEMSSRLHR